MSSNSHQLHVDALTAAASQNQQNQEVDVSKAEESTNQLQQQKNQDNESNSQLLRAEELTAASQSHLSQHPVLELDNSSKIPNMSNPHLQQHFNHSMRREDNIMNGYSSSSTQLPSTLTNKEDRVGNSNGGNTFTHSYQQFHQFSNHQYQQQNLDMGQNSHLNGADGFTAASRSQQNQGANISEAGTFTYKYQQQNQQQNPVMLDNSGYAFSMNAPLPQKHNNNVMRRGDYVMNGHGAISSTSTTLPSHLTKNGEGGELSSSAGYSHGLGSIGPMHQTTYQS